VKKKIDEAFLMPRNQEKSYKNRYRAQKILEKFREL